MTLRVMVAGGTGVFGRYIVEELSRLAPLMVVTVAARKRPIQAFPPDATGAAIRFCSLDLADFAALRSALSGYDVLILAAGPFQTLASEIVKIAASCGVHYIDLCDDPGYFRAVHALAPVWEGTGRVCLTGLSSLPGISLPLASLLREKFDEIEDIEIGLFIGNANRKGRGAVFSSLSVLDKTVPVRCDGVESERPGWSEPIRFPYPLPIGEVKSYLFASPDVAAFAERLPCKNLSVRVGFEWILARAAFSIFRILARAGGARLVRFLVRFLFPFFSAMHFFGTQRGSVAVVMRGQRAGIRVAWRAAIVGEKLGQRMASLPAVIACEALARGDIQGEGVLPLDTWLKPREFLRRLERTGMILSIEEMPASVPST